LHGPPACVRTNGWLAIVSVAVRGLVVVLACALYVMLPGPFRFWPFVIDTHEPPLVADHVQPDNVVTVTVPLVASAAIDAPAAES
jgi:hypothetical protein